MHRLAVFTLDGTFLHTLGERGSGPGQFNYPLDADFDADGDLYVLDALNTRVQRFHWDGTGYRYVLHFGEHGTASGSFQMPKALAVTPSGHVYITDSLADKVTVFDRDGTFLLTFGGRFVASNKMAPGGLNMPAGIAADENDGIWIADTLNGMVHRFQYLNESYLRDHPITAEQLIEVGMEALPDKPNAARAAEGKR
jgi:DNA-binding beta-propeller fold protein YncE